MRLFIAVAIALGCCAVACSQNTEASRETTTLHVITDLIEVPVFAYKFPFRPEKNLTQAQFVVRLDGGTPFHPSNVRLQGAESMNISVLVEADTRNVHLLAQSLQTGVAGWPSNLFRERDRVSFYIYGCRLVRSLKQQPSSSPGLTDSLTQAVALPMFLSAMEGGRSCPRPPLDKLLETVMVQTADAESWNLVLWSDQRRTPGRSETV